MKELYCDKCGSSNIEDRVIDFPNSPIDKIKMSEYKGIRNVGTAHAVIRYYSHRLTCRNCGFTSEYTA